MFCTLCLNDHGQGESCEASRQSQTATLSEKIKVVRVEIPFGEGTILRPRNFPSLAEADRFLKHRATEAPANGGYWKTDFVIHFADGETYKGTYCLKQHDSRFVNLIGRHVHNFAMFYSGMMRTEDLPSHLKDSRDYDRIVARHGHAQDYKDFLAKYELW